MAILDDIVAKPPPIHATEDGAILVDGTRIPVDTVIRCFREGRTPEDIVQSFTSLRLPDVYAIITYYLWYPDELDAYLAKREAHAQEVEQEVRSRWPAFSVRERLLSRKDVPSDR
jgi:uncharacterized protein (DUF433 family)